MRWSASEKIDHTAESLRIIKNLVFSSGKWFGLQSFDISYQFVIEVERSLGNCAGHF